MTNITAKQSNALISRAIANVKANKLADHIQTAIVAIISHAEQFGDCSASVRLIEALPRHVAKGTVINHFRDYSPINIAKVEDTYKCRLMKADDKGYRPFDVAGVTANRWDERPDAQPDDVILFLQDEVKALTSLADRYAKIIQGKVEHKRIAGSHKAKSREFVKELKALAERYGKEAAALEVADAK